MKPTGASRSTASVPRKSRSPSARTVPGPDLDPDRGRDSLQGDAGTRRQRLEQHVPRAGERAVAAAGRVQPRLRQGPAGPQRAADALAEGAVGLQRHQGRRGLLLVALLERSLCLSQRVAVHAERVRGRLPLSSPDDGDRDRDIPRRPHGRRAALRRRLLQARAARQDDPLRPQRRRQVDPAAGAGRRAHPRLRQPRRPARCAGRPARPAPAPRTRARRSASTSSPVARTCSRPRPSWRGSRSRWRVAAPTRRRCAPTPTPSTGSRPAAAIAGATKCSRCCAASASARRTSSARSRPSPAAS